MHRVLESYVTDFSTSNGLTDLALSDRFEHFVNFVVAYDRAQYSVDPLTVTTTEADDGSIDGAFVLIGDQVVTTVEEATAAFAKIQGRRTVEVEYVFMQAKTSEHFDLGEILKFSKGVSRLLLDEAYEPLDPLLVEMRSIHELVVKNLAKVDEGRPTLRLYFACAGAWSDGNGLGEHLESERRHFADSGYFSETRFLPLDRNAVGALWLASTRQARAVLPFQRSVPLPSQVDVTESYIVLAKARDLVVHLLSGDDGRLRSNIFDQNVRDYLGDDNQVNSSIRRGLVEAAQHGRFALLNNGVTIVAPDVQMQADRMALTDFQIVNGCQTCHVLFRARNDLTDEVWVTLKVIETSNPDLVGQIVEATNSQSPVDAKQFLSTKPYLRRLEDYFNSFSGPAEADRRLYFERRTRQYDESAVGRPRVFDIRRLARAFASMFLDVPHLAARYPTQAMEELADRLFLPEHREIPYYAAALALYRLENAFSNRYVPQKWQNCRWHLLMGLKYLAAREQGLTAIPSPNSPKIEAFCQGLIRTLSAGGRASAPPFLEVASAMEALGEVNRDRLRSAALSAELRKRLSSAPS